MASKLCRLASALTMMAEAAAAQPAADEAGCRRRVDEIASMVGVPGPPVVDGSFSIENPKVAVITGQCDRSVFVTPEPEPFGAPLSPAYPGLAARVAASTFALRPAEARRAVDACVGAAVADPPRHAGRAGFARQRWRDSQMTGRVRMLDLRWECTYHGADKRAASFTISRGE